MSYGCVAVSAQQTTWCGHSFDLILTKGNSWVSYGEFLAFNKGLANLQYAAAVPHIEPSVGSRGDSYDNALAETINGLYKAELIHRRGPWKTKAAAKLATLEWVSWFNHHSLLEPIGYIPPAEAEENYYRQLAEKVVVEV